MDKKQISAYITVILCGAFLVVFLAFLFSVDSEKPQTEEVIDTDVTFEEIYNAYKTNELAADEKYKGNRYQITATIESVSDDGVNGLLGSISVVAKTYAGEQPCGLFCTFDEETQREALSKLTMGEEITFVGICDSWGNWSDCKLIPSNSK